jgi:uncharacterized membrane protein YhaH (DUF805 family)
MMEDMLRPLSRYATFSGRARRTEYWLWTLFLVLMLFLLMYLDTALGLGGTATSYSEMGDNGASVGVNMSGGMLTMLFLLATLLPSLAVSVRRLHDVGRSGWLILLALIPLIGWLYLLFQYVQPGTQGGNRFGPDPKGGNAAAVA